MKERIDQLRLRIDALSLRERGMLFLVLVAVLYMLAQVALFGPQEATQKRLLAQIASQQKESATLTEQIQAILQRQSQDPDAENRRLQQALSQQVASFDTQINAAVHGVIPPQQMPKVLEEVLNRQTRLKLVHLENLGATPLLEPVAGQTADNSGIFKQGVKLEFDGDYLGALAYLQALQKLPWQLFWDEIDITMDKYPSAHITIVVHTISLSEGWIGV